jgi:anti-sigma factor RsiW
MTCLELRSQLDRYLDRELTADEMARADEHLGRCDICRDEFASHQQLKQLLVSSRPTHEPRDGFWDKSHERIMARTVLSDKSADNLSVTSTSDRSYTPLMRSILSVAASVALLAAALVLGSRHDQPAVVLHGPSGQIIVSAVLVDAMESPDGGPLTTGDQRRLGTASILAGGPGLLGRFSCLPGLLRVY